MLFDWVATAIYAMLSILLLLFPSANPTTVSSITSSVTTFRSYMAGANWIFPVDTFFTVLGLIIAIESSWLLYKLIRWLVGILSLKFIS